jgi:hypothetical protein
MGLFMRLFVISVILSIATIANAFIINNEANAKIQQTHHLAVIKLSERRAAVAMYVNFTGIPAGKKVTYILPFMYKPENFKIAESSSMGFYADYIQDVDKQIDIQNDITNRNGSKILQNAWSLPLSIPIMTKRQFWVNDESQFVNLYKIEKNKSFDYKIVKIDNILRTFNKPAGFSTQQLEVVQRYCETYDDPQTGVTIQDFPSYADITLTGIGDIDKNGSRGMVITFSQKVLSSEYRYPLENIAALNNSIPMTDIYISCPDEMQLFANAPIVNKITSDLQLRTKVNNYFIYGPSKDDQPLMSSKLTGKNENSSVFILLILWQNQIMILQ